MGQVPVDICPTCVVTSLAAFAEDCSCRQILLVLVVLITDIVCEYLRVSDCKTGGISVASRPLEITSVYYDRIFIDSIDFRRCHEAVVSLFCQTS